MDKFILIIKYILVALVQGVAEILPISSSAHLIFVQTVLQIESSELTFEIFLHFASLIAIIFFFRKKLIELIKDFFFYIFKYKEVKQGLSVDDMVNSEYQKCRKIKKNFMQATFLVVATIPAALAGLLLKDIIDEYFCQLWIVGIFLILTSGLLYLSTRIERTKTAEEMTFFDALIIGLFQCIGLFPGISRSGSCLIGSASRKIRQNDAAEFAFLMAIPIILGSTIVSLGSISETLKNSELLLPYLIAFIVCLVSTYFALQFMLKIIRKKKLTVFSLYCLLAGIIFILTDLIK